MRSICKKLHMQSGVHMFEISPIISCTSVVNMSKSIIFCSKLVSVELRNSPNNNYYNTFHRKTSSLQRFKIASLKY